LASAFCSIGFTKEAVKLDSFGEKSKKALLLMHSTELFNTQGSFSRPGLSFDVSKSILIGRKIWMSGKCYWVFFMRLMGAVAMLSQFTVDLSTMQMRQLRFLFAKKH
jgi:hypothetical protein